MRISDADLHLLRVFDAVVRCGGFAAAQAELNVNSSTISRHISDLERRLGVRLCTRGRSGFHPTEEGKQVVAASRGLFDSLDHFASLVAGLRGTPGGELKLGTTGNIIYHAQSRLAAALARFRARGPSVHLSLYVTTALELERALAENHVEIAIGPFPDRVERSFLRHKLFFENQYLYCAPGHPFFERGANPPGDDEINQTPLAARGYISVAMDPRKAKFNLAATAYSDEGVAQLILSGAFVGFLPEHYAEHWVAKDAMRRVAPDRLSYRVWYSLAHRKGKALTRAGEMFLDELLAAHAQGAGAGGEAP